MTGGAESDDRKQVANPRPQGREPSTRNGLERRGASRRCRILVAREDVCAWVGTTHNKVPTTTTLTTLPKLLSLTCIFKRQSDRGNNWNFLRKRAANGSAQSCSRPEYMLNRRA